MGKKQKQGNFVKAWRKFRDLSQSELAEKMGISREYVSLVENGKRRYDEIFLDAAAQALNCSPADLISREPGPLGGIWNLWDQIDEAQREQALKVLETFKKANKTGD